MPKKPWTGAGLSASAPPMTASGVREPKVSFLPSGDIQILVWSADGKETTYMITRNGIGRYPFDQLLLDKKPLGKGAQASVTLCTDTRTKKKLAMKECYFSSEINKSGLVSDLAHVLNMEDHPNVVASHDVYFREQKLMILMEYCSLGSLSQLLDAGPRPSLRIPMEHLSYITRQVVEGLHHLHSKRIIHRDMKPSNILMNGEGVVKICDFGVSKTITQEKLIVTEVGAKAYLSPERVRSEGYFMPSDVWALGVTIAELALGDYPWSSCRNMYDLIDMLADNNAKVDWPADEHYCAELKDFVSCCIVNDPTKRWTTGQLREHPFLLMTKETDVKFLPWLRTIKGYSPWKKARTQEGDIFYVNVDTGDKQWKKPTVSL